MEFIGFIGMLSSFIVVGYIGYLMSKSHNNIHLKG